MAVLLKGAPVAAALRASLKEPVQALMDRGIQPTLSIVRVGKRPDDLAYERSAVRCCDAVGVATKLLVLPESYKREKLLDTIRRVNDDDTSHGCLLLRPLPCREDETAVCALLSPEKDVDGITQISLAGVFANSDAGFPPCTAQACMEILDYYGYTLTGKTVTVVGRSLVIGKPVSMLLQNRDATVTMCHSRTTNLAGCCRASEILVAAAGRAGLIDKSCLSPGQIVLDVGMHPTPDGHWCGDVVLEDAESIVDAITPVPGGVGAVTTAVLAQHVVRAARAALR